MSSARTYSLTIIAMSAFAGNSLLCRLAFKETGVGAAAFTSIRIISGALTLWLLIRLRQAPYRTAGSWPSALALFIYAAGFSYAYLSLPAATGALLLFGAVQATMVGYGIWSGERLSVAQTAGLLCAFAGLTVLLLPGVSAPPLPGALLMLLAGVAWGVYSLRGKGAGDPTAVTAGNFLRAVPMVLILCAVSLRHVPHDPAGIGYAIASGALASGVGYALWYRCVRGLPATSAATVQLSVPVLTAIGGIICLGEPVTLRLLIASTAILGGIALVIIRKRTCCNETERRASDPFPKGLAQISIEEGK